MKSRRSPGCGWARRGNRRFGVAPSRDPREQHRADQTPSCTVGGDKSGANITGGMHSMLTVDICANFYPHFRIRLCRTSSRSVEDKPSVHCLQSQVVNEKVQHKRISRTLARPLPLISKPALKSTQNSERILQAPLKAQLPEGRVKSLK